MNAVTCLICGATIESRSVHDFQSCNCEDEQTRIYVDGGHHYTRRVFGPAARWRELPDGPECSGGPPVEEKPDV